MGSLTRDDNFVPGVLLLGDTTDKDIQWKANETSEGAYVQIVGVDAGTTTGSIISTNNSTTTVLDVDEVFTGVGDDCLNYSAITILIDASHDSATNGILLQFSPDNTNWDEIETFTFDVSVTPALPITHPVISRYFRLVYTNGSTLQTHFRVQTLLHANTVDSITHKLSDSTPPEYSGLLTKSAIVAQAAGSGLFVPVQATAGGNLKTSLEEIDGTLLTTTQADGLANTIDGLNTTNFNYVYNGTTWDRMIGEVNTAFDHGRNSDVDTAAEQITTTSVAAKFGVLVKAANGNAGTIYVGNSDVTANSADATDGFELGAGESVLIKVDNANKVYVIASEVNQIVYWMTV
ncbi:MAG: hypothetical protein ACYSWS_03415 [Planctomycetota bacterium]|jgi:hypothetical protein